MIGRMKRTRSTLFFLAAVIFYSCSTENQTRTNNDKPLIVVSTGMIQDVLVNIVGNKADVMSLMGPGVDPHLYKATQGDIKRLNEADIIFYNGLYLEGKMGDVLSRLARIKPVVASAEKLPADKLRASPIYKDSSDPHVWFDVALWMQVVENINYEMQNFDSVNAAFYDQNAKKYLSKLDSLHNKVIEQINTIPKEKRVLITSHDAFGYFGDAYDMEVKGLQGISTVSDFGLKDITQLVDFIIERKIQAVFVETSVSEKALNAVVEGCHKRGYDVNIGGTLYSDAMGARGSFEGTYIGMVSSNVEKMVNALK